MMYSSGDEVTLGSTEAAITNVKLLNWTRYALYCIVVLVCAAVLMTQPPEYSLPLFAVVAATSLGAGLMLSRQQPTTTQPSNKAISAPSVDFGAADETPVDSLATS